MNFNHRVLYAGVCVVFAVFCDARAMMQVSPPSGGGCATECVGTKAWAEDSDPDPANHKFYALLDYENSDCVPCRRIWRTTNGEAELAAGNYTNRKYRRVVNATVTSVVGCNANGGVPAAVGLSGGNFIGAEYTYQCWERCEDPVSVP